MKNGINWDTMAEVLQQTTDWSIMASTRNELLSMVGDLPKDRGAWRMAWKKIVPLIPNDLKVEALPPSWFHLEGKHHWEVPLSGTAEIVKFADLLNKVPYSMLLSHQEGDWDENNWSCRDHMLDKYLYVCSIFQREKDSAYRLWKEQQEKVDGEHKTLQGKSVVIKITPPKLVYNFNPFRKAGSQYIAEWAVSDMRKPQENSYNWHGQNTSRWLYAGCLLVDNGRVSIHT